MSATNAPKSLQTLLGKSGLKSGKLSRTSRTRTGGNPEVDHDTLIVINMLFARFALIYGHKFESQYSDEEKIQRAKREWALSLAGTSRELVEYALERCKLELSWPPTIADFVRYLEPIPEALGLPPTRDAYLEACQNSHAPLQRHWSHAAVQLAARDTGYFKLRSEPERHTWPAFQSAYQDLVKRLADGEELVVERPETRLPSPDLDAEQRLVERLIEAGAPQSDAYQLAYYLEKPAGSDVRARYRRHSLERLEALELKVSLPE